MVRVLRSGLATTVQDLGRAHLGHFGIVRSGAMDHVSHELANGLVGNPADAATLEMTLSGDELEWSSETVIAITGADFRPVLKSQPGEEISVPQHRPVLVRAGTRIRFHTSVRGCRCYVAVRGGFDVPVVMGSRSTWLRAGIGGYAGRTLLSGDELLIGQPDPRSAVTGGLSRIGTKNSSALISPMWFVRPMELPLRGTTILRVIPGGQFQLLTDESRKTFRNESFTVSPESDRMGYRLSGTILSQVVHAEMLSEGVAIGTIQLPPDGNPIVLMADSAPTGGYPRIAHIIAADVCLAAQIRPGQAVQFQEITLETAHRLLKQQKITMSRALMMADLMLRS